MAASFVSSLRIQLVPRFPSIFHQTNKKYCLSRFSTLAFQLQTISCSSTLSMMDPFEHHESAHYTPHPPLSNMASVSDELLLQSQIHYQQQSSSPVPHMRNGSFQYPSPSAVTSYQAELQPQPQPYASMHGTPQSSTLQTPISFNGFEMQRGGSYASHASMPSMASPYSSASSGQHFGYGHYHQQSPFSACENSQRESPFDPTDDIYSGVGGPGFGSRGSASLVYPPQHSRNQNYSPHTTLPPDFTLFDRSTWINPPTKPATIADSDTRFWPEIGLNAAHADGSTTDFGGDGFAQTGGVPFTS